MSPSAVSRDAQVPGCLTSGELGNVEFQDGRAAAPRAATESHVKGVALWIDSIAFVSGLEDVTTDERSRLVIEKDVGFAGAHVLRVA